MKRENKIKSTVNDLDMQQINKTEMNEPQHMLSMKQPPLRHEVLIITIEI